MFKNEEKEKILSIKGGWPRKYEQIHVHCASLYTIVAQSGVQRFEYGEMIISKPIVKIDKI